MPQNHCYSLLSQDKNRPRGIPPRDIPIQKIKPDLECNCVGKNSFTIKTKSGFLVS
jgi:hypothetical protein